jgi:hypothetical protein
VAVAYPILNKIFNIPLPKKQLLKTKSMKKIIYILLLAFSASVSLSACTEEEVTPSTELKNGGGGVSDPK